MRRPTTLLRAAFAGAALAALAAAPGALGATLAFDPAAVLRVPSANDVLPHPTALVTVDLTGDGRPDIVTADQNTGETAILVNQGGQFSAAIGPGTGAAPDAIAAGDLNDDGNQDVVVGAGDATVTVLFGNGHGAFTASTVLSGVAGCPITAIALGDLTGDGRPDLAAGDGCGQVLVWRNRGAGNITFQALDAVGAGPIVGVAVAEIDGDGNPDVVAADAADVFVTFGTGGGALGATTPTPAPFAATITDIAVGEIDGVGGPDVAVLATDGASSSLLASLVGNGDGTFSLAGSSGFTAAGPSAVALGDLNGDGALDAAVSLRTGSAVRTFLNAGGWSGVLSPDAGASTGLPAGCATRPADVAVADLDGDGWADLATADFGVGDGGVGTACQLASNAVSVLRGAPPSPAVSLSASALDFGAVTVGEASAPQTVSITNQGPGPLNVTGIGAGGPNAADFALSDTCVGAPIAPGASCAATVSFAPGQAPAPPSDRAATLEITSNAVASPQQVALAGRALAPAPGADLQVTLAASPAATVAPGGYITYTATVRNLGPGPAASAVLRDEYDAARVLFSSAQGCTNASASAAVTCGLGTLASGTSKSVAIRVRVRASAPAGASIANAVRVSSASTDPNDGNNAVALSNPRVGTGGSGGGSAAADLQVTLTNTPSGGVKRDQQIVYTARVTNAGPAAAAGVVLTDRFDGAHVHFVSAPGCGLADATLTCGVGGLASGSSRTFTITVRVNKTTRGAPNGTVIADTASASATTADPDAANNTRTRTNTVVA